MPQICIEAPFQTSFEIITSCDELVDSLKLKYGEYSKSEYVAADYIICAKKRKEEQYTAALDELSECISQTHGADVGETVALTEALNRFLRTLPRRDCDVFVRRCFYAESAEEIAARHALRPNTVTVSLHRTRKKLREYLIKEGYL